MGALVVRRLLSLVPTLLLVSFGVFALISLVPGDAAVKVAGGDQASTARIEQVRHQLGLDDPFAVQYEHWVTRAAHGDLGRSLVSGERVDTAIWSRLPVTLSIALAALFVCVAVGLPLGLLAGLRPGGIVDRTVLVVTSVAIGVPSFVLAMGLVTVFAVHLRWFEPVGFVRLSASPWQWLRSVTLPALALGAWPAASLARQIRAGIVDALRSPYVRTAWAKGAGVWRVVSIHALKNAAIASLTVVGLQL